MSETWTPSTSSTETWTTESPALHVFSSLVFSHAISATLRVFALGSSPGGSEFWDNSASSAETWVNAA